MRKEVTQNNGTFTIPGFNFKHGLTTKQQGDFRSAETDRIQALAQRINTKSALAFMKACFGKTLKEIIKQDRRLELNMVCQVDPYSENIDESTLCSQQSCIICEP